MAAKKETEKKNVGDLFDLIDDVICKIRGLTSMTREEADALTVLDVIGEDILTVFEQQVDELRGHI